MRKAVVTEALGFKGYFLCQRLLEEGIEVAAIDQLNDDKRKENRLGFMVRHALFEFREGDLSDGKVKEAFNGADVCYYFGARTLSENVHKMFFDAIERVQAFQKALEDSSFSVLASSTDIYRPGAGKIEETSEILPVTLNGMISLVEEAMFSQKDLSYAILRFPEVYGPSEPLEGSVHQLTKGIEPERKTNDLIYIDDAVEALFSAANHKARGIYNVASGKDNQWNLCQGYVKGGHESESNKKTDSE